MRIMGRMSAGVFHGGNLGWATRRFGQPTDGWLDLSTGVNPFPYAVGELAPTAWTRLPAPDDLSKLRDIVAHYVGVSDSHCIVPAPGSQAILQWLPRLFHRARVRVLAPTYEEHAFLWTGAGHDVEEVGEPAGLIDGDVAVVTNPNNPDGRVLSRDAITGVADRLAGNGGAVVVDETFADVDPDASVADAGGRVGLVVVRSFGKFFGLPGLRLGFALAEPKLAASLETAMGPWAVSGPALAIGGRAYADRGWIESTRRRLAVATDHLDECLIGHGLGVVGGTSLFRLAECDRARQLFEGLARRGVLVRHFESHPRWLRFGLADESGIKRLDEALRSALR